MRFSVASSVLCLAAAACVRTEPERSAPAARDAGAGTATSAAQRHALTVAGLGEPEQEDQAPKKKEVLPPVAAEAAPPESPRLPSLPPLAPLLEKTRTYFEGHAGRRIYVQIDKPMVQPGETVWIKSWDVLAKDLRGPAEVKTARYELVSPKGSVVLKKRVAVTGGTATNDFEIPEGVQGGEYLVRVTAEDGVTSERPLIVSAYEPPRIKKKLELLRKAYGAGDEVTATIEVKRATGEPLAKHPLRAVVWVDGETLAPVQLSTNEDGGGLVRFKLPAKIERGDGLLTVLVEDGGVTESIAKSIPIIVRKMQLSLFPEGGQLIAGLPARLYFEAKNSIGKPADVEGRIVDDQGNAVATFKTHHAGLGRVDFVSSSARSYFAELTRPAGITERYVVPIASTDGCVLRTFDDLDGQEAAVRLSVRCSSARNVVVVGVLREQVFDAAAVAVPEGAPAVVHLKALDEALARAQGVLRVTVFGEKSDELVPIAERLVFRNRRSTLKVKLEADQPTYVPREQVVLSVETTDPRGQPVPAELAVSIVDDTVISFADDKNGHMTSRLLLESELPDKVEEPNFFLDLTEAKSALALDLLMGTRGWRKFEWQKVTNPPPPSPPRPTRALLDALGQLEGVRGGGAPRPNQGAGGLARGPRGGGAGVLRGKGIGAGAGEALGGVATGARVETKRPSRSATAPGAPRRDAPSKKDAPPREPPAAPAAAMADEPKAEAAGRAEVAAKPRVASRPQRLPVVAREAPPRRRPATVEGDRDWAAAAGKVDRPAERKKQRPAPDTIAPVRVFPAPAYSGDYSGPRTDFRETIHWAPAVLTGKDGKATITFHLSDAVTSFRVFAEGSGGGFIGRAEKVLESKLPFSMSVKLPLEVTAGDKILLPLTMSNERDLPLTVAVAHRLGDALQLDAADPLTRGGPSLAPKARQSWFFPVSVVKGRAGTTKVSFSAEAGGLKDELERELDVVPLGFPVVAAKSGTLKGSAQWEADLGEAIEGSVSARLRIYPSALTDLIGGIRGMLREPSGCFEQASSSNYPNVMVLKYLRTSGGAAPDLVAHTTGLLERGYHKLTAFETKEKGYEWFGRAPGHEALSAYGLLQFIDMKQVFGGVDDEMLERTRAWLVSRRDGKGGYLRDQKALDSFGRAPEEVTNAYVTYALVRAGQRGLDPELAIVRKTAESSTDAYLLALAVATLAEAGDSSRAAAGAARLVSLQEADGSFKKAQGSITRSGGQNLTVETTALAVIALLRVKGHDEPIRRGVEFLVGSRGAYGGYGATQATVLALRALSEYQTRLRAALRQKGTVTLMVNGVARGTLEVDTGKNEPIELRLSDEGWKTGLNTVSLESSLGDKAPLRYTVAIELRSMKPPTHPEVAVDLATKLERAKLGMGETVRLTATIKNKTAGGLPMTIARIGLPSGLAFQSWQLKELREKGTIAFYETRAREVIVYFRELEPNAVKEVPIDLVAAVPGEYVGPASSAYLYYTDDRKVWVPGLEASIAP